jgi:hypothetical protein
MNRISNRKKDGGTKSITSTKPMATKNESPASAKGSSDNDRKRNPTLNSFGEVSWENKIELPTEEYWEWCCCAVSGSFHRKELLLTVLLQCGKYQRTFILGENYKQEICKGLKGYECKHKRCDDCSELRSTGKEETVAKEKVWAASKEGKYYDKWCPE